MDWPFAMVFGRTELLHLSASFISQNPKENDSSKSLQPSFIPKFFVMWTFPKCPEETNLCKENEAGQYCSFSSLHLLGVRSVESVYSHPKPK